MSYPQTLTILDPTGLIGREIAESIADRFPEFHRVLFHTGDDEEHLVAEVAGEASIVSRLDDPDELTSSRAVIVTETPRAAVVEPLLRWLRAHPEVVLIDASQPGIAPADAVTVLDDVPLRGQALRWYHLVDPSLAAATRFLSVLGSVESARLVALRPASAWGAAGLEELAAQGVARLSGATVPPPDRLPSVLAFDLEAATGDALHALERQLAELLPAVPCHLEVVHAGVFHGHAVAVSALVSEPTTQERVKRAIRASRGMRVARKSDSTAATAVVGEDDIVCANVRADGTLVSAWVVADGLRAVGPSVVDVFGAAIAS